MSDDEVTLGELYRISSRIENDLKEMRQSFLSRVEFAEGQKAQGERIGRAEADIARIQQTFATINRMVWTAIVSAVIAPGILVAILAFFGGLNIQGAK